MSDAEFNLSLPRRIIIPDNLKQDKPKDTLSSEIVTFNPISYEFVLEFYNEFLAGTRAPDVELFVLLQAVADLNEGAVVRKLSDKGGFAVCSMPFKEGDFEVSSELLKFLPREQWSTESVAEYLILEPLKKHAKCFVETIPKKFVGKPFQGLFISQARRCRFSELVESITAHYDAKDLEMRLQRAQKKTKPTEEAVIEKTESADEEKFSKEQMKLERLEKFMRESSALLGTTQNEVLPVVNTVNPEAKGHFPRLAKVAAKFISFNKRSKQPPTTSFEKKQSKLAKQKPSAAKKTFLETVAESEASVGRFLWLDIFCVNQPLMHGVGTNTPNVVEERYHLLNEGLHTAITNFDERAVFFDSFQNPAALERGWCIWELYGITKNDLSLDVLCKPQVLADLTQKLIWGNTELEFFSLISNLDPSKMSCFDKKDLQMITDAVLRLENGFSMVKSRISEAFRLWIMRHFDRTRKSMFPKEDGNKSEFTVEQLLFLLSVGKILLILNEKETAEKYLLAAFQVSNAIEPLPNEYTWAKMQVYRYLGNTYLNFFDYRQAQHYYELELDYRNKHNLFYRMNGLYINYALVQQYQGFYDKAGEYFKKAEEALDKNDFDYFDSWAELCYFQALYYVQIQDYQRAVNKFQETIDQNIKKLGENHINTGNNYYSMAYAYLQMRNFQAAEKAMRKARLIRLAVTGDESLQMMYANAYLGMILLGQNNPNHFDEVDQLLEATVKMVEKGYGGFETIFDSFVNLRNLLRTDGRHKEAIALGERMIKYFRLLDSQQQTANHKYLMEAYGMIAESCFLDNDEVNGNKYRDMLMKESVGTDAEKLKLADVCLENSAFLINSRGNYNEARRVLGFSVKALTSMDVQTFFAKRELLRCYYNLCFMDSNQGDVVGAMKYFDLQDKLFDELQTADEVGLIAYSYFQVLKLMLGKGKYAEVVPRIYKFEDIARKFPHNNTVERLELFYESFIQYLNDTKSPVYQEKAKEWEQRKIKILTELKAL